MGMVTAIVLAAGKGNRMQSDIPKQFLELHGKPVLYYSLKAFEASPVDRIILVTSESDIAYCKKEIIEKYHLNKITDVVSGGTERYWSVKKGLLAAKNSDIVLIHDAARPCLTLKMIEDSIMEVQRHGACTLGVPVKDTIKIVDGNSWGIETPDRRTLWQIQTPQSFLYKELVAAYEKMEMSGDIDITDDTMIMERYLQKKTKVIMGDYCNIKITTPEDLDVCKIFLEKMKKHVDTEKSWC